MNFFMPTVKLISKKRIGSKIKKVYDKKVISPYQRLLASDDLSPEVKAELTRRFTLYDPVKLQREVHNAVDALVSLNKAVNLEGGKSLRQLVGDVSDLHAV
jgi:hypothetical protein